MLRKITPEEIKALSDRHIEVMDQLDEQKNFFDQQRAEFREQIKALKEEEGKIRAMLRTGQATGEQLKMHITIEEKPENWKKLNV